MRSISTRPKNPRSSARWSRHRATALLGGLLLAVAGLVVPSAPAYADAYIMIAESADPVTVNTPYAYTVTVPVLDVTDPVPGPYSVSVTLSGAAATFTSAVIDDPQSICQIQNDGATAECFPAVVAHAASVVITLTVLPTATGTVTADAELFGFVTGTDSEDTTISPPAVDIDVDLAAQPHLGILVPYLHYTVTAHNNGPGTVTSATLTATLPAGKTATNLSAGCTSSPGTVVCTYGAIANGADATSTFRLPLSILSLGNVTVAATRTASTPTDNNASNDNNSETCTVVSIILATC